MPQISIVATMYQSQRYIKEFYQRVIASLSNLDITDYEIILVDDGSPDNSLTIAKELADIDSRVKVIELSRNFGHHKAIMTGLSHSEGERVFLIDIDLEEEPELLIKFWNEMVNQGPDQPDVVFGVQQTRKGGWFERISGSLFYKIFNFLSDEAKLESNCLTARLMSRNYVKALCTFKFAEFYFAPVCSLVGFKQISCVVNKKSHSPTTYSLSRKYSLLVSTLFYFSTKPLYFIFYMGILITIISFSIGIYIFCLKVFGNIKVVGWTSTILSIWFIGGVMISFLGVQAIYMSKLFSEIKQAPFTIIKQIYSKSDESSNCS